MTEFSTDGTGAHGAGLLRVSGRGQSTKGADVLGALGADVVGGPALEASDHGGRGRGGVGNVNWIGAGTGGSHNHLQSSG